MSESISKILVINMALDRLEEEPITTIDPAAVSTKAEEIALRIYDQKRRATLRKHSWNFATKRDTLAALAEQVPFGSWDDWYVLPSDYIRFSSIGEFEYYRDNYSIENGRILVRDIYGLNTSKALPLKYVYDFKDMPKADPLFIDLFVLEMAIPMAGKLAGKNSLARELRDELDKLAPEAYSIDGQDSPPRRIERSRYLEARRGRKRARVYNDRIIF